MQRLLRQLREPLGDLRMQLDSEAKLPEVFVDPRRVEQVLHNLLDNARKFSPPGGLLTIRLRAAAQDVLISVVDQGPGIPVAEHERVFAHFYQIDRPGTRHTGGTGLGLTVCQALVEAHGGRIWIEETSGGGTTVCLTLPVMPSAEPVAQQAPAGMLVRRRPDEDRGRRVFVRCDAGMYRHPGGSQAPGDPLKVATTFGVPSELHRRAVDKCC